jgi:hypothetical protein
MGEPPLLSGVLQLIVAAPPVPEAVTPVGAVGIPAGITPDDALELDAELPVVFEAVDVNV